MEAVLKCLFFALAIYSLQFVRCSMQWEDINRVLHVPFVIFVGPTVCGPLWLPSQSHSLNHGIIMSTTNRSLHMINNVVTYDLGDFKLRLYHEVSKVMFLH